MLEMDLIQTRGFRNIVRDGKAVGFELRVRLTYYRGIFLSQLRPKDLVVDGVTYAKESLLYVIDGEEHSYATMQNDSDTHWCPERAATIRVYNGTGLEPGYHTVHTGYMFSSSYLPPQLQEKIDDDTIDPFLEMMFGQLQSTRKMLLVC